MIITNQTAAFGSQTAKNSTANTSAIEEQFAEYLHEDSPEEILKKITEKGVQSLLEHKIDQMKKDATERAMASRGVSEADLAAMDPQDRTDMMQAIMDEVQRMIKQAMNEQMKRETRIDVMFQPGPMAPDTLAQVQSAQEVFF